MDDKIKKKIRKIAERNKRELSDLFGDIFDTFNVIFCSKCEFPCCSDCSRNEGYFGEGYNCGGVSNKFKRKYGFTEKYGFLAPRKGCCKIPRSMRSVICTKHTCSKMSAKLPLKEYEIERLITIYEKSKLFLEEPI